MTNLTSKQKIIAAIIAIGIALIGLFYSGIYPKSTSTIINPEQNSQAEEENSNEIKVLSVNPNLDSNTILLPTQPIVIKFNQPLENRGELKIQFTPEIKYDITVSNDKKTATITPQEPYKIDRDHTLILKPDSKFDGKKTLGKEYIYHFRTIKYSGV